MLCKQYMYIYLRFYLYVYSCIESVEIFIGGGVPFKKLSDAYLLRNKKNMKKKRMLQLNFMLYSFKLFLLNQCFICNSYEMLIVMKSYFKGRCFKDNLGTEILI